MAGAAAKHSPPKMAAQTDLTPCILERKILPKVWGGRALESVLGIELPGDQNIGETWELYDRPDGSSAIRESDQTLRDLMEQSPEALLGRGVEPTPQGRFPLLLKFIDAKEPLSVQVHPDAGMAAEVETDSLALLPNLLEVGWLTPTPGSLVGPSLSPGLARLKVIGSLPAILLAKCRPRLLQARIEGAKAQWAPPLIFVIGIM